MWQMLRRGAWAKGLWANPKDDGDLVGGHLNLFDKRSDNLTA